MLNGISKTNVEFFPELMLNDHASNKLRVSHVEKMYRISYFCII